MKNPLQRFSSILKKAKLKINELNDRLFEIMEPESKTKMYESEQSQRELWDAIKQTNVYFMKDPGEKRKRCIKLI